MVGKLTDAQIRRAKPLEKAYKLSDGAGLHLYVPVRGNKLWRLRYEFGGKEKLLSIGPYPEVSVADARAARDLARADLRAGKDPSVTKKQRKVRAVASSDRTFEAVARDWHSINVKVWTERHGREVLASLEADVFPDLGSIPITDIDPPMALAVLRAIEKRGAGHIAQRVRQRMSAVFVFAIASGLASSDPAGTVKKAMAPLVRKKQPALRDLDAAREMIRKVDAEFAHPVTRFAHRLLALTVVRPGTLAETPWTELRDLSDRTWTIPAVRMKLRLHSKDDPEMDHLVPLSTQALEVIDALRDLTGRGPLVFPNTRNAHKPMSENAIGYLLNRAGYHGHHVPHGWRATFSTIMNERFKADRQIIDLMLAHMPKEKVEAAYNRALHLDRRRELAQIWADLIMEGQAPIGDLVSGRRR